MPFKNVAFLIWSYTNWSNLKYSKMGTAMAFLQTFSWSQNSNRCKNRCKNRRRNGRRYYRRKSRRKPTQKTLRADCIYLRVSSEVCLDIFCISEKKLHSCWRFFSVFWTIFTQFWIISFSKNYSSATKTPLLHFTWKIDCVVSTNRLKNDLTRPKNIFNDFHIFSDVFSKNCLFHGVFVLLTLWLAVFTV